LIQLDLSRRRHVLKDAQGRDISEEDPILNQPATDPPVQKIVVLSSDIGREIDAINDSEGFPITVKHVLLGIHQEMQSSVPSHELARGSENRSGRRIRAKYLRERYMFAGFELGGMDQRGFLILKLHVK
jgi:hypothetical protein